MLAYCGLRVTVTETATAAIPEDKWDWSRYRSPSRAKRRRHREWIVMREPACFQTATTLIIHPVLWDQLCKQQAA